MEETSAALTNLFFQYTHLPIGGKEIRCPYWRNRLGLRITGPFGGKGRPQQIVEATKKAAQEAKVNLQQMSEKEILAFMKRKKIGVDCSGFVFWMLDALDKEKKGKGIAGFIPRFPGTLAERQASADKLTGQNLTVPVKKMNEVRVGDVIRLDGGKHIAIAAKVVRERGAVEAIEYAHSSEKATIHGVHSGLIRITNPEGGLAEQEWEETLPNGGSYKQILLSPRGDGIRRLKIWA
jgi:hypothetical protein